MFGSIWYTWPWFSLLIFALFVRIIWRFAHERHGNPLMPSSYDRSAGSDIAILLIASLVVGAAICIVIETAGS